MVAVWHFDGASGVRQNGALIAEGDGFRLHLGDVVSDLYYWPDLVSRGTRGEAEVYGLKGHRGWQIGIEGYVEPDVARHLPTSEKFGRWVDRIGLVRAAVVGVVASALAIVLVVRSPEIIAPLIPSSWERSLGDAMIGDFGGRFCNGAGGQEALNKLVNRIEPGSQDLKVHIANINMVNAVALPGNHIIIFRGLLQQAKSPDEVAGVIGHEIGHVRNRDVMQALLRQMGISIVLGGVGDAGGYASALVSMTYSREAESKADQHSIKAMQKGSVSPADTADFFARLAEAEGKLGDAEPLLAYVSSHPQSALRQKAFATSAIKGAPYTPAITPTEWRALIDSCKNDPNVKAGGFDFF